MISYAWELVVGLGPATVEQISARISDGCQAELILRFRPNGPDQAVFRALFLKISKKRCLFLGDLHINSD